MKAAARALASAVLLGGCGVFAPEARLDYPPPLGASTSLQDAYAYADDAKSRLYSVGSDNSAAQTLISYGAYLATVAGAGMVAFSAPATALKGLALGAGATVGLDYVANPRIRRAIANEGVAAIACLQAIALGMDGLPQGFGAAPASVTAAAQNAVNATTNPATTSPSAAPLPRNPVSVALASGGIPYAWRRVPPAPAASGATPAAPSPPVPVAETTPRVAADSLREYASSLLRGGGLQPPSPRIPGAPTTPSAPAIRVPSQIAAIAAGRVLQAADTQEAAMVAAASSAKATSASAPRFLARNTETVLNLVLQRLHGADRAAADVETQTRAAVTGALKNFQGAASNAEAQSSAAKQTLSTTAALTGSVGGTTATATPPAPRVLDMPPSGLPGEDFPPLSTDQGAAGPAGSAGEGTGAGSAVGKAASSSEASASKASTQLTTDTDVTSLLRQLTDFNTACQGLAPGS